MFEDAIDEVVNFVGGAHRRTPGHTGKEMGQLFSVHGLKIGRNKVTPSAIGASPGGQNARRRLTAFEIDRLQIFFQTL